MMRSLLTAALVATTALFTALGQNPASAPSTRAVSSSPGAPEAGKALFDGPGHCLSCHRVGASGSVLGPNLTTVGSRLSAEALKKALLDPPREISLQNKLYRLTTTDQKTLEGKLLNQGPFTLQLLDSNGQLVAYDRKQVQEGHFIDPPKMQSYKNRLTDAQIDELVAYLASLRDAETPR